MPLIIRSSVSHPIVKKVSVGGAYCASARVWMDVSENVRSSGPEYLAVKLLASLSPG
jgi:hypothetical protein